MREEEALRKAELVENSIEVPLDEKEPSRTVLLGSLLAKDQKRRPVGFLNGNKDVFAITNEDMLGIDPNMMVHCLNMNPKAKDVK